MLEVKFSLYTHIFIYSVCMMWYVVCVTTMNISLQNNNYYKVKHSNIIHISFKAKRNICHLHGFVADNAFLCFEHLWYKHKMINENLYELQARCWVILSQVKEFQHIWWMKMVKYGWFADVSFLFSCFLPFWV